MSDKPRPRNAMWDALAAALGQPVTRSECRDFGKTVAELTDAGADPAEIAARIAAWTRLYPTCRCTHRVLRNRWGEIGAAMKATQSAADERYTETPEAWRKRVGAK